MGFAKLEGIFRGVRLIRLPFRGGLVHPYDAVP